MSSEVKANKVSPATGTDFTFGDSGDTFTVPSGATLTVASGGTITNSGTATGFPSGLSAASIWVLTTDFTGDAGPIASNLAVYSGDGYGSLGSAMTESSGIFTFPSTGYWLIEFNHMMTSGDWDTYGPRIRIQTTTDNSNYTDAAFSKAQGYGNGASGGNSTSQRCYFLFDITDTTNCKCKFAVDGTTGSPFMTTKGSSTEVETSFMFTKLGDT